GKPEKFNFSNRSLVNIAPDDFIYADDSPTGKSIFRATKEADSIKIHEVFNLALNPKRKSPFSYIGDFVANPGKNRMAYAYKYFKIIKFMDLEAQTVRTVNFEREEFDENSLYKINGLDQNVTHYWGACAQDESVYFLYSGRTPYDVSRENSKNNCYIYVEQYDWNGNPVNKFRLDQWGYFTVDEPDKKIYLFSTNHDDPFFIYDLP
ncbi:MAG: TolB-like 6-bladed beta-propeller domain-containing protein, partial [Tannerella sp.]|nr:TolB-like 6-bladed beta-propeller domain-containing protein [Tannerella sp.]